ncbi:uncharacterized protein LOC126795344 [Argentina anserina]|uniref:uncharacterized protein LOC126795344 n=1 Tax=Argentina anserina TaxID=57926 RepID=UPI0021768F47|nr:uncharacterized protein LOC126795344 [Potentilla anserina]
MEDSGAILCQISSLTAMLDQVNEELEANIQIMREIESEIVKCSEFENAKESDLTKTLYVSQFELIGLVFVTKDLRSSIDNLGRELDIMRLEQDETVKRIHENRERFMALCIEFQKDIDKGCGSVRLRAQLSERECLQNEMLMLDEKNKALKNSMMAFIEGILEDLNSGNSALQTEIQNINQENEKLLKDIDNIKTSLLSSFAYEDISGKIFVLICMIETINHLLRF